MAAYIKFEGLDGECTDKGHEKWSPVESFGQVLHKQGGGNTGTARRTGDVSFEDISVTKMADKISTKLAESVAKGKVYPKVEIHVTASYSDDSRVTYFAYELKKVLVTSYQVHGHSAESRPLETLSLNFEEIKLTYTEYDDDGKKVGSGDYAWNVPKGASA